MELSPSSYSTQLAHALQGVHMEDKKLCCSVPVTLKVWTFRPTVGGVSFEDFVVFVM